MKLRKLSKRAAYITSAAIAVLLVAGIAFAYFTSTGSGTGSATVGSAANDITVTGTGGSDLYPGGPGVTVSFTASNGSDFNQKLSNIQLVSVSGPGGCDTTVPTVFHMADVAVGADGNLAPNASSVALTETGMLYMEDNGANQDPCQGGSLMLTFSTT
jgi:hypothetical protein